MSIKQIRSRLRRVIIDILLLEERSLAEDPLPELFSAYDKAGDGSTELLSGMDAEKAYRQTWLDVYSSHLGCNLQEAEEVLITNINWYDYNYIPADVVVEAATLHAEKMFAETVAIRQMYLDKHNVS